MVSKKYNQFVQQQMKETKPDTEKLIEIGGMIREVYGFVVHREPILLFDKIDGHLVKTAIWITEEEYHKHIVHVPDIMFYVRNSMWIFEIDGWIHNVKDKVAVKDERRDECYTKAKLNFQVYNEWEILLKLEKSVKKGAKPSEIFHEMQAKLDEISKQEGL